MIGPPPVGPRAVPSGGMAIASTPQPAAATPSGTVHAVVAGGGTAGHVLPALAIIDGLVARGHDRSTLLYVGARRGIETRLVPPTNTPAVYLDVIGLQLRFEVRNVLFPIKLVRAVASMVRRFGRQRPGVVVSVGGYASLPAVLAARLRKVPIVVVSYDKLPGRSSRAAAKHAAVCATAFADSTLPRARLTGAPLRQEIINLDAAAERPEARRRLGLPEDRFVVSVFGGSQGSGALNTVIDALVERWAARSDVAIRHVVGERFLDQASPARDGQSGILYQVIGYEAQMPQVYAASDVVLVRAGASTIAEVATVGIASIIVPWPLAADDHQTINARILGDHDAAVVVAEPELSVDRLADLVERMIAEPEWRRGIAERAREAGAVHRSGALIDVIDEVAGR
jgi:UDP-N-acetylglucosamine--N-acetylmuramyl-(pentapeptide) pyrophosphoryl-undecaprenol N-acetylglucosamine transferase